MTQFNPTFNYSARSVKKVISIEAKKRCQILRDIEFRNELKSLGLSIDDVDEKTNTSKRE